MSYELKKMSRPTTRKSQQISDEKCESVSDESDTELLKDSRKIQEGESERDRSDTRLPKDLQEKKVGESERDKSDTRLPKDLHETKESKSKKNRSDTQVHTDFFDIWKSKSKKNRLDTQVHKDFVDEWDDEDESDISDSELLTYWDKIQDDEDESDISDSELLTDSDKNQGNKKRGQESEDTEEEGNKKRGQESEDTEEEAVEIEYDGLNTALNENTNYMDKPTFKVRMMSKQVKQRIAHRRHTESEDENERGSKAIDDLFKYESEETVLRVFNDRIDTDTILYRDELGRTLLHRAVENNFPSVADLFIDYGINPMSFDSSNKTPLHIAIDNGFDEMAALIVSKLPNFVVRRMFGDRESNADRLGAGTLKQNIIEKGKDNKKDDNELYGTYNKHTVEPMFKIKELISKDLDKALLQVLDSFVEEQPDGLSNVHVKLLDVDENGTEPNDKDFNFENHTAFQSLTSYGKKDALNHPVVRVYMEHKWKHWCQKRFLLYGCLYLFSLFCLTYSAVTGITASDVYTYDTRLQRSRAVTEVISYLYALAVLFTEIRQILRHRRSYLAYFFNFMELFSSVLILLVLPLRYIHLTTHWYVFALGYFLWAIRIFKYATVFSQSGVYVEVIKLILVQDFVQFSILLVVINTIFSGTFLLVLKADGSLYTHVDTSSFFGILYVGVRTLIEAGPVVDYTGSDGYRVVGTIIMLVYMFFTIVVMLNILIAQLSETYNRTHKDCIKTVRANRAMIIARAERNHLRLHPIIWDWTKYYTSEIHKVNMKTIKKNFSTLDVLSRKIDIIRKKQLKIGLDVQTMKRRQKDVSPNVE